MVTADVGVADMTGPVGVAGAVVGVAVVDPAEMVEGAGVVVANTEMVEAA